MHDRRSLIDARGLAVGYRGGPPVLEGVTFAVAPGERVGVLGPNGGGKTALLRALLEPRAGALAVNVTRGTVPQTERSRLDFPVSALDVVLIDALAAEGRCVLVSTHDVGQARAWDHVLCLNRRQIDFGPPELTLTEAVLAATYEHALVRLPAHV